MNAVRVSNLGKKYRISHQLRPRYTALRDVITDKVRAMFSARASRQPAVEDFWALRGVSFEVQRGEVLGVIGRNGAGKSTLLKVLSQITEPTEGRVELDGRVASLLEVGAGFHPELTGRENIRLNGAILGMSSGEIARRFDEIVDFAGVEKFLDTPVKRYSSGMYMRLAFSVAAHLEPEILIIDEVLAVGDAEFQKKCLGKMKSVASSDGRTVLFVSHNMAAIETLCTRAMLLRAGNMVGLGPVAEQIEQYTRERLEGAQPDASRSRALSPSLTLEALSLSPSPVQSGGAVEFTLRLSSTEAARAVELAILLYSEWGARVAIVDLRSTRLDYRVAPGSPLRLTGRIRALPLVEGDYAVGLYINCGDVHGDVFDLTTLSVSRAAMEADFPPYGPHARGVLELSYEFDRV
jgi:lipopolysaccharide transport system ATP-binding protein